MNKYSTTVYIQGVPKKCMHTLNDYKYNVY